MNDETPKVVPITTLARAARLLGVSAEHVRRKARAAGIQAGGCGWWWANEPELVAWWRAINAAAGTPLGGGVLEGTPAAAPAPLVPRRPAKGKPLDAAALARELAGSSRGAK